MLSNRLAFAALGDRVHGRGGGRRLPRHAAERRADAGLSATRSRGGRTGCAGSRPRRRRPRLPPPATPVRETEAVVGDPAPARAGAESVTGREAGRHAGAGAGDAGRATPHAPLRRASGSCQPLGLPQRARSRRAAPRRRSEKRRRRARRNASAPGTAARARTAAEHVRRARRLGRLGDRPADRESALQ